MRIISASTVVSFVTSRLGQAVRLVFTTVLVFLLTPNSGWACGCGCSIFDVRTGSMLPMREGGAAYLEYNHVDQDRNWSGSSGASAADNGDKRIRTDFYTVGAQYMFNAQWGMLVQIPYEDRYFRMSEDGGDVVALVHSGFGDLRIKGIYSGFSPDMSSGLSFGLKVPTGDFTTPGFDRDTQVGTGSTDLLLGGFIRGLLPVAGRWDWFMTCQLDQTLLSKAEFHPGAEINGVVGVYYGGWKAWRCRIAPVAQAVASHHWADGGSDAHSSDSGYDRLLLSPGVEIDTDSFSLYADVAFPLYQSVNGNQLMAPELYTVRISYNF